MQKHEMPDLSRYTKSELIELIKAMAFHANPLKADEMIRRCLIEIDHRRTLRRLDEADAHSKAAFKARERYVELVKPYHGKPYSDIPLEVLREMKKCLHEAEYEEKMYLQISIQIEKEGR